MDDAYARPSPRSSSSSTRAGTSTATTTSSTGTPACARRSRTSRSSRRRSPTRSIRSTTRSPTGRARSPSRRSGPRRCSPTRRSRCPRATSAMRRWSAPRSILPLVGRRLPVIADEHVDPEFGTGALKITPGHDPNDFEIGRRHGLDEISVIGEDGLMTDAAGERFAGMEAEEARDAVVEALRAEGLISAEEPYEHDVPHSARSGRRVEPLISLQWFCDMTELAKPAIEVVRDGRVRFHPEKPWAKVYLDWLEYDPPLVRLAPALVGAPASRLVLRRVRGDLRRRRGARALRCVRRRASARRGRPRHVVLLGALAVRDAWAGRKRRPRFAPGIRPTSSRRRGTSSSSGSPGW